MKPYILKLPESSAKGGTLSFIEGELLPFEVRRVFWIYGLQDQTKRGGHAHVNADQILICISGSIQVSLEDMRGCTYTYNLKDPSEALFFPRKHWLDMVCSHDAIVVVLASNEYIETEYIRAFDEFTLT